MKADKDLDKSCQWRKHDSALATDEGDECFPGHECSKRGVHGVMTHWLLVDTVATTADGQTCPRPASQPDRSVNRATTLHTSLHRLRHPQLNTVGGMQWL